MGWSLLKFWLEIELPHGADRILAPHPALLWSVATFLKEGRKAGRIKAKKERGRKEGRLSLFIMLHCLSKCSIITHFALSCSAVSHHVSSIDFAYVTYGSSLVILIHHVHGLFIIIHIFVLSIFLHSSCVIIHIMCHGCCVNVRNFPHVSYCFSMFFSINPCSRFAMVFISFMSFHICLIYVDAELHFKHVWDHVRF